MASKKEQIETLGNELQDTKDKFSNFVVKSEGSISSLERMIARENSTTSASSLVADLNKIGEAYFHNVYVNQSIDIRSNNIGKLEPIITDMNDEPLPDNNPTQKLFDYINDNDSPFDFFFEVNRSLDRFGKCFIISSEEKRSDGSPQIMYIIPANTVKPIIQNNILKHWQQTINGNTINYPLERVLFIKWKNPNDDYDGLAPGSAAVKEILQDYYAQIYNIKFFQNGAQGKGAFKSKDGADLSLEQKEQAQFAVDQTFNNGLNGAHRTAVINRNLEWINTGSSAKDMEFKVMLDKMRDDILVAYGIPKVLFVSAETTFTNLKEAKKLFWTQVLLPIVKKIENSYNTNFFEPLNLPYKLKFKIDVIPELQEDISSKMDSAAKLYAMNVPISIINELLELGLPEDGWEGWDKPTPTGFSFDKKPDNLKEVALSLIKEQKIQEEKQINIDEFYKEMEYQKTLSTVLFYEKQFHKAVSEFYAERWKEVQHYIELSEIKAVNDEEELVDPSWLSKFSSWMGSRTWGTLFLLKMSPLMDTVFNRGVFRTYSGIGADLKPDTKRAIQHIINRGLKIQNSPKIVQDTIVDMLGKETWTVNDLAKELSKKWDGATLARAKNVAQTETTSAYNGGRLEGMKELGIKKKQWLHSKDGKVRSSHKIDQIIPVDEYFDLADGYRVLYPGDGDPAHACNCRCVLISVL